MTYPNAVKLVDGLSQVDPEPNIGRLLLDADKLTSADVERVVQLQKTENLRFGEAAIKLGLIAEADLQHVLSHQFSYTYLAPGEGHFSPELIAAYEPFGDKAEQVRALRSQLMLRWFSNRHKTLTIAGINAGDGASYLAANLAVVFSQLGERTLLIDADLRRPRQHVLFNLGNRPGLSELLTGRVNVSAVTRIPAFPNLSVLTAGAVPPNPAELLSRAATPIKLEDLAEHYDVILIDTSAAHDSADAEMVAARTGAALLVLRQDHTQLAAAAAFQANLASAGAVLIGTVLNRF
ncbi:chain-length determining protein [Thiobacillus denitrificans]|uniref:Chain-length determining protein n=2 Tax=Thiobacillus denitrificans TaxID=36861 RepID=A0A125BCB3_THIDE|nr:chain-length determining protein [Thiobacillus denitrificans]